MIKGVYEGAFVSDGERGGLKRLSNARASFRCLAALITG